MPSSNNGWLYTAYAQKLGLPYDQGLIEECARLCTREDGTLIRSPGKELPPMSRDEILGMHWLGVLPQLKNWSFSPYPIPDFNPLKTLSALWRMRNKHRNALWQDGGEPHLFHFAFKVPRGDRRHMLQQPQLRLLPPRSLSSYLIEWRKGRQELDVQKFIAYFGEEHPFVKSIRASSHR